MVHLGCISRVHNLFNVEDHLKSFENSLQEIFPCRIEHIPPSLHEKFSCREFSKVFEFKSQNLDYSYYSKMSFRSTPTLRVNSKYFREGISKLLYMVCWASIDELLL